MSTEPRMSNSALKALAIEFLPYDHGIHAMLDILLSARRDGKESHLKQLLIQFARHDMDFKGEWVTRSELEEMILEETERKL